MKSEGWNLKTGSDKPEKRTRSAFTLLELLVAMVILTIAMSIAFQAFSGTIRGWKRGIEVMDGIKHGDFAMTHLVSAINSTIYFSNPRKTYAFEIDKSTVNGLPGDLVSFVTSSGAFMPAHSPFTKGPHRLTIYIDEDSDGPGLFATALPAIANSDDVEDEYDPEPILVSRMVQGLEILIWNEEQEDWTEEWEAENSVPERILLVVYVASESEYEEPIEFVRTLEIPVAKSIKERLKGPSSAPSSGSSGSTSSGGGRTITVGPGK